MVNFSKSANEDVSARQVVRNHLSRCEAMCPRSLIEASGLEWATLDAELESLEREGEIEILRPMFSDSGRNGRPAQSRSRVHYRLIRPSDSDFLWEQNISAQIPSKRIRDALQLEARNERPILRRSSRHR